MLIKKEEQDGSETKQEPMETEDKKSDIKAETKEEDESRTNGTTSSSPPQSRRKSIKQILIYLFLYSLIFYLLIYICTFALSSPVFKPEELRQALMPTLESLYRQDPESLPFRQPVDPILLGIPVSPAMIFIRDESKPHKLHCVKTMLINFLWDSAFRTTLIS